MTVQQLGWLPERTADPHILDRMDQLGAFQGWQTGPVDHTGGYGMGSPPGVGWVNPVTGMGTTKDKTAYGRYTGYSPVDLITLANLYHGDDLCSRIVDTPCDEMFRTPFHISLGDQKLDEEIGDDLERLCVAERFDEGARWGQLFGGGWVVLGADDGQAASESLRPEHLRNGVEWLQIVDRRFMWPVSYYSNGPKAGTPERYVLSQAWVGVSSGSYVIHESRMIRWPGVPTGQRERNLNASYEYSLLDRAWPAIRMFATLWKGAELLMTEGNAGVHKIKGLAEKLMAGNEKALIKRLEIVAKYRSMYRDMYIDSDDEEFERLPLQLTGIPQVLAEAAFRVAAAAQIPSMILFAQDPSGLNATGEASLRWFWDRIDTKRKKVVSPRLKELIRILLAARGVEHKLGQIKIDFEPLYTPTALEKAQTRAAIATADKTWIDAQVITPEEAALSHFQERGEFDPEYGAVDRDTREKVLKDVLANYAEGAEPGAPMAEDTGKTPKVADVRGFGLPEQPVEVGSSRVPPLASGAQTTAGVVKKGKDE